MKNSIYKCVGKVCAVLLTLLGFTAPITLASCYGPMPEKYYTSGELTDSIDSLGVQDEDSVDLEVIADDALMEAEE
ncbi:MAG: hypothetical protein IKN44_03815 [Bacteroidaceae bacterium]|jgi:hypothetical protein|nr:hypothetical protein [Bacteroidaceae bacterium]